MYLQLLKIHSTQHFPMGAGAEEREHIDPKFIIPCVQASPIFPAPFSAAIDFTADSVIENTD